jgi:flagellar protein FliO/FliZ
LGGEKLKPARLVISAVFLILFLFANNASLLYAQAEEPLPSPSEGAPDAAPAGVDESAIILGETPAVPAAANGSSVFVMLRMILVLALAALAIYGVVFIIKRLARPQEIRDPYLKVLAKVPLGADSFAAVLSLGPRAWLVGGGSGGLNLISEIDDAESLETMLLDDARKNAETGRKFPDFRALLGRLGPSRDAKQAYSAEAEGRSPPVPPGVTQAEALRKQRERLKGL